MLRLVLFALAAPITLFAQTDATTQNARPDLPTTEADIPPALIEHRQPLPLPSMRDAPLPDLATLASPPPKSRVARKLRELVPSCVDSFVHTCWGMPVGEDLSENDLKFQKNREVAVACGGGRNYAAAADRYREAFSYKPDDALVNFRLGECLLKMDRPEDARPYYEQYLKLSPNGAMAGKAKKAVSKIAAKN